MDVNMKLSGVSKDFYSFNWEGNAVSINQRSTVCRGRIVKTSKYRGFCNDLDAHFASQKMLLYPAIELNGPVVLFVKFWRANHRGHYLDNDAIQKPMQDALEKSGIVKNDSQFLGLIYAPIPKQKELHKDKIEVILLPLQNLWEFNVEVKEVQ